MSSFKIETIAMVSILLIIYFTVVGPSVSSTTNTVYEKNSNISFKEEVVIVDSDNILYNELKFNNLHVDDVNIEELTIFKHVLKNDIIIPLAYEYLENPGIGKKKRVRYDLVDIIYGEDNIMIYPEEDEIILIGTSREKLSGGRTIVTETPVSYKINGYTPLIVNGTHDVNLFIDKISNNYIVEDNILKESKLIYAGVERRSILEKNLRKIEENS